MQAVGGNASHCSGDGTNRYYLAAYVHGKIVASSYNANAAYSKTTTISFGVPANTAYTIISNPYNCPSGRFSVMEFIL